MVKIAGELDLASAGELSAALDELDAGNGEEVEIDARGVTFCDSVGLRALLTAAQRRPVALRTSPHLERMLEMTSLRDRFRVI